MVVSMTVQASFSMANPSDFSDVEQVMTYLDIQDLLNGFPE